MQTIIETQGLTFGYPKEDDTLAEVLHGINLSIEQGQFVAVLGHNGSGKSTWQSILMRFYYRAEVK